MSTPFVSVQEFPFYVIEIGSYYPEETGSTEHGESSMSDPVASLAEDPRIVHALIEGRNK